MSGTLLEQARENMKERFVDNPCRGIVCGLDGDRRLVQLSWIMGRSNSSQNREYVVDGHAVRTQAIEPSKVDDPSLIIYKSMLSSNKAGSWHVVSNGSQTDSVVERLSAGSNLDLALHYSMLHHTCEPDAPIFTPRITGVIGGWPCSYTEMALLRAEPSARQRWTESMESLKSRGITRETFKRDDMKESEITEAYNIAVGQSCGLDHHKFPTIRSSFGLDLTVPGIGYCLTTYQPRFPKELRSFVGEPFAVPIEGSLEEIAKSFWDKLEPEWRVAIAAKLAQPSCDSLCQPYVHNKFRRAGA